MSKTLQQILKDEKPEELRALFQFGDGDDVKVTVAKFNLWGRYHFPKFFKVKDAKYHHKIDEYNTEVYLGLIKSFTDIAYRGGAKTTRTKIFFAYVISNDISHDRKYMKILSQDGTNSKQSVTDIYNMLIEPRITKLYPEIFAKSEYKREETMSSFTTATGVKLKAGTVGTSQRGDLQEDARPDVVWFDDFETKISLKSAVKTAAIWDNMQEAIDGLSKGGGIISTCNYLSERGNVHKLVEKGDGKNNIVLITPIYSGDQVAWPAQYTLEEAKEIVEKAEDGAGEYLCQPSKSKDVLFDRAKIDAMEKLTPIKEVAGFRIYKKYDASHRYGAGQDVSGGMKLDSSTNVIMDFHVFPAEVVACFDDNEIKPDVFGDEIDRQCSAYGECIVCPEANNYGHATIGRLKQIYPTEKIWQRMPDQDKVDHNGRKPLAEYGWETNAATKPTMLFAFCKAVNDGHVILNDARLIAECRAYTRNDLMDADVDPRLTTRHFDLLIAACLAWQMKDFSEYAPEPEKEQTEDEPLYPDIGV